MAEADLLPTNAGAPLRRAFTNDDSHVRNRRQSASTIGSVVRRRSSNFSDLSLAEARKAFQESTDDILLPKPSGNGHESSDTSAWHSAPLAFALLPAIGGMLFKNGSSVITDVMLLGLAAIFLNWSVRLPWDWYHSAQAIRVREEYNSSSIVGEENEDDHPLSFSQTSLDEVPEEEENSAKEQLKPNAAKMPRHEAATNELYTHEILALFSCFVFPLLGAYLLHTIRGQLSRPSEGLVSNYNLTIFILASELRPMAHLVKLIQSRTLHLQRMVNSNPYEAPNGQAPEQIKDLVERLEALEARTSSPGTRSPSEIALTARQTSGVVAEVRRALGPDIDALNRATRRYEKRATLQAFQTDSKIQELDARLNDAISLAAAAANSNQRPHGFTGIIIEWAATAVVLPIQAVTAISRLPFKTLNALIGFGRKTVTGQRTPTTNGKNVNGRSSSHSRASDRFQGRVVKR